MSIETLPPSEPLSESETKGAEGDAERILTAYAKAAEKRGFDTTDKAKSLLGETLRVDGLEYEYKRDGISTGEIAVPENTDKVHARSRLRLVGKYAVVADNLGFVDEKGEMRVAPYRGDLEDQLKIMHYVEVDGRRPDEKFPDGDDERFPVPLTETGVHIKDEDAAARWQNMTNPRPRKPSVAA